jgi:hypothetical protein
MKEARHPMGYRASVADWFWRKPDGHLGRRRLVEILTNASSPKGLSPLRSERHLRGLAGDPPGILAAAILGLLLDHLLDF